MFTKDDSKYDVFKHFHISEKPEEETELIEHFNHIAKKHPPYLLTLGECEEKNLIGENNTRYNDKRLLDWVQSLIVGINDDEMNMDNHTDMTATERHNNTYHCCKIMYLVDQYRTVGLHSTIQGIIEGQHMFVHPGMSRVHALWFLKARNEKQDKDRQECATCSNEQRDQYNQRLTNWHCTEPECDERFYEA